MNAFSPLNIGRLTIDNRIIRSATHEGLTENGDPDDRMVRLYERLSEGGVGCIITGYAAVSRQGMAPTPNMMIFDDDSHIDGYKRVTDRIRELGTPVILQIAHCGRQTRRAVTGEGTVAPSPIRDWLYNEEVPHELTDDEIQDIIDSFVSAAERAERAGFDGVQLHSSHGYLLSSFLSPHMNVRKDRWGGSTENRFRIIGEIAKGIRSSIGDFPMLIKINCFERSKNGIDTAEAVRISKLCETAGFDAIEVSCGTMEEGMVMARGSIPYDTMFKTNFRMKRLPRFIRPIAKPYIKMKMGSPRPLELYNLDAAAEIRRNVNIPVIVVGGIRSINDIETIVGGECDAVSMSRPFVIEPDIVNRFRNGQERSKCTSCNRCLLRTEGFPLRCHLLE